MVERATKGVKKYAESEKFRAKLARNFQHSAVPCHVLAVQDVYAAATRVSLAATHTIAGMVHGLQHAAT